MKKITKPTDRLNQPQTFEDTNDWLKGRVNVATKMTSREIALSENFRDKVRANCFFSAQVADAHILERIRKVSDSYSRGKINLSTARSSLKSFLVKHGYTADDVSGSDQPPLGVSLEAWKEAKKLSNLASTARLNLILNQNAAMSRAVGKRQAAMDPDILERFPYYRYVPSVKKHKRPEHKRLYNLVLPKNDPFWNTHTPPSDFACGCSIEDVDAEEAGEFGGIDKALEHKGGSWKLTVNGKFVGVEPNKSGYVFDISEAFDTCEMSRIHDIPVRRAVLKKMKEFTRKNFKVRFTCTTNAALTSVPVTGGNAAAMEAYIKNQAAAENFSGEKLVLGNLSNETADSLGITEASPVLLEKGSKNSYGLEHMAKRHKKELTNGRFNQALRDTLFRKDVKVRINLAGNKMSCTLNNPETGAFTTLRHYGQNDEWKVVSAHYPGETQIKDKGLMK